MAVVKRSPGLPRSTLFLAGLTLLVAACAPFETRDSGPTAPPPGLDNIPEPVPRNEPRSRYGNPSSYEVFGRTYYVMDSAEGYSEEGVASWYGKKFHGQRTSSGEEYDMYALTAAHTRLPLPTYVRVTNLENNRSVIVRVNDRGPFAHDRIIDLSYAAAHRLGLVDAGTGRVRVEALSRHRDGMGIPSGRVRIQVGAFGEAGNARALKERLEREGIRPVHIRSESGRRGVHRVQVGPLEGEQRIQAMLDRLARAGFEDTRFVHD
ncbi:septal ring lytic transglycosylase RlpA family protein [Natronospira bacteriovora]|uniref:Endolytic peptidoglycan transglycosylase RlpA n=1 Tax=Natronospira bacteriovora TaxID=3069753 RepID=A0ABU0W442_9GAMM|nr:septal ring lytic transglycosylase RlpA family protein [Natronospira sp. AB-CW4]MDQ2068761.1 septal ring lytic transglycosylase RlpA family protein [Natronospira sp. AB-CW4]